MPLDGLSTSVRVLRGDWGATRVSLRKIEPTPRLLRLSKHLSVRQVAEAVGCSPATLFRWEKGEGEPTLTEGDRWAAALGISVHALRSILPSLTRAAESEDQPQAAEAR